MKDFEKFLEEARPELERIEYSKHPSQDTMVSYVYEQMDGPALSQISIHIATCPVCYERVAQLRRELGSVEEQLSSALPDPLAAVSPAASKQSILYRAVTAISQLWNALSSSQRRSFYRQVTAYAATAVFLLLLNTALDRLLVPPSSPLASPALINRWWAHLYWLLLPWGLFLIARVIYVFLSKKRSKRRDDEK